MPTKPETTHALPRARAIEIRQVHLVVVAGPDAGKALRDVKGVARIGTAPKSDLALTDKTVSRLHCEVHVSGSKIRIVDSGSANGTVIAGVRVRDVEVEGEVTLEIGSSRVKIEIGDDAAYIPLSDRESFGGLVGASVEMRQVYAVLERVAPTDVTVLLQGETGTGKEVAARAIHEGSSRASAPFVAVDCGAVPESLIESELFGHVKGAFSGAIADRAGVFEEANGGTLFLDEIGELPLALQPKLLRVLETREVRRVGGTSSKKMDVRVIAATNRPLAAAVNSGEFREDLYYRLAVVEVQLPPLRARRDDIPRLAEHLHRRFAGPDKSIPKDVLATLPNRSWPGNVRQLRNFVERAALLGWSAGPTGATRSSEDPVRSDLPYREARRSWLEAYLRALLVRADGNVTRAAELAGVNRRFLQRLLARKGEDEVQ